MAVCFSVETESMYRVSQLAGNIRDIRVIAVDSPSFSERSLEETSPIRYPFSSNTPPPTVSGLVGAETMAGKHVSVFKVYGGISETPVLETIPFVTESCRSVYEVWKKVLFTSNSPKELPIA